MCSEANFRELLGRLQFATQCVPMGQQHLHTAWRVLRAQYRYESRMVQVGRGVVWDLSWWEAELTGPHEGVPLASCAGLPAVAAEAQVIYADASGDGGFAQRGRVSETQC